MVFREQQLFAMENWRIQRVRIGAISVGLIDEIYRPVIGENRKRLVKKPGIVEQGDRLTNMRQFDYVEALPRQHPGDRDCFVYLLDLEWFKQFQYLHVVVGVLPNPLSMRYLLYIVLAHAQHFALPGTPTARPVCSKGKINVNDKMSARRPEWGNLGHLQYSARSTVMNRFAIQCEEWMTQQTLNPRR